jgi:hypothetical protein
VVNVPQDSQKDNNSNKISIISNTGPDSRNNSFTQNDAPAVREPVEDLRAIQRNKNRMLSLKVDKPKNTLGVPGKASDEICK